MILGRIREQAKGRTELIKICLEEFDSLEPDFEPDSGTKIKPIMKLRSHAKKGNQMDTRDSFVFPDL